MIASVFGRMGFEEDASEMEAVNHDTGEILWGKWRSLAPQILSWLSREEQFTCGPRAEKVKAP